MNGELGKGKGNGEDFELAAPGGCGAIRHNLTTGMTAEYNGLSVLFSGPNMPASNHEKLLLATVSYWPRQGSILTRSSSRMSCGMTKPAKGEEIGNRETGGLMRHQQQSEKDDDSRFSHHYARMAPDGHLSQTLALPLLSYSDTAIPITNWDSE